MTTPTTLEALAQEVQRLNNRLTLHESRTNANKASVLVHYNVPAAPDVIVGMAVYFDVLGEVLRPAKYGVVIDDAGAITWNSSAIVQGFVIHKHGGLCDVALAGFVADFVPAGASALGAYGLSPASAAGQVTYENVANVLAYVTDAGTHIYAASGASPVGHTHGRQLLRGREKPESPDGSGYWVPDGDTEFPSNAPVDATWWYAASADSSLSKIWPPRPDGSATLLWDPTGYGLLETPSNVARVVDGEIYWVSSDADPVGDASLELEEKNRLTVVSTRELDTVRPPGVESLISLSPEIVLAGPKGNAATNGPLRISLDMSQSIVSSTDGAAYALKNVQSNGRLTRGPVVAKIIGGVGVSVTSTGTAGSGDVTIGLADGYGLSDFSPTQINYEGGAENATVAGIPIIKFDDDTTSPFVVFRFELPAVLSRWRAKLSAVILADTLGTPPALQVSQRRVTANTNGTLTTINNTLATGLVPVEVTSVPFKMRVETSEFDVVQGDVVYVTVSRPGADAYGGRYGIASAVLRLVE